MNPGVTENETMNKTENKVAHQWKILGYVGIIFLNLVFTSPPAFSANPDDEIAELKATIKALQRRVEALETQQEKKEIGSPEI
ncbi:MAG: hypothetical protein O7F12_05630 [Nitrospirae bacterium]|nr:hypothetical protein [Nitrospirota bacterium]